MFGEKGNLTSLHIEKDNEWSYFGTWGIADPMDQSAPIDLKLAFRVSADFNYHFFRLKPLLKDVLIFRERNI